MVLARSKDKNNVVYWSISKHTEQQTRWLLNQTAKYLSIKTLDDCDCWWYSSKNHPKMAVHRLAVYRRKKANGDEKSFFFFCYICFWFGKHSHKPDDSGKHNRSKAEKPSCSLNTFTMIKTTFTRWKIQVSFEKNKKLFTNNIIPKLYNCFNAVFLSNSTKKSASFFFFVFVSFICILNMNHL